MAVIRWSVPKDALEATVALLENVPPRNTIKTSEFIKVTGSGKDGAMFHLSASIGGKALLRTGEPFPFDRTLFLDRRLFIPFVLAGQESKASEYMFIGGESKFMVKHGNRKAVYAYSSDVDGYEEPSALDKANSTGIGKRWAKLVDCAENIATDDPIMPALNCVYVSPKEKRIEIMSSNEQLVFYARAENTSKLRNDIAFPLGLIKAIRQEHATKLVWTDKVAIVEFPKGKLWQAVKSAARKSFPHRDIRKTISELTKSSMVCSVNMNSLAKVVDRLQKYTSALSGEDLALEIRLTKGSKKIQLSAGVLDSKFDESVYSLSDVKEDVIIEWPLLQVIPVIVFSKDEGTARIFKHKSGSTCIATKNIALAIAARSK